ncbi:uncharacterized protein LOC132546649 [Ylistrum balloti]|uniref:uncharacterized protein LOC132546649 n=1 Tax=Ylistrum balloti TaxID=509963 RepID=UPI002905C736|nr:uncharacterized protein LOC132546649 [Ylistrum balloti]
MSVILLSRLLALIVRSSLSFQVQALPHFLPGAPLGHIKGLGETSGLCASRVNPNILYAHNDKGDGPSLYALNSLTGELKKTIHVHGAHNYDWEDIACGPCSENGGPCIYIGDIGNHDGDGAHNMIYKIREPTITDTNGDITVDIEAKLPFVWYPHQVDAETLMVDPKSNIYVISKVSDGQGKVGTIASSVWNSSQVPIILSNLITLPLSTGSDDPTGGDISPDGHEILLQTHHQIFHWQVTNGLTIFDTFRENPVGVPFHYVSHAGAVAWDAIGRGYYTASEGHHRTLYYYAKQG